MARDTKWQETKRLATRLLHICLSPHFWTTTANVCLSIASSDWKKVWLFSQAWLPFSLMLCCQHLRIWLSITSHLKIGSWLSWRHHWPPLLWLAKHGAVLAPRALGALQSSQQLMRHLAAWASSDAPAVGTWAGHPASQVPFSRVWQLADGTTWKKMVNGPDPTSE